MEVERNLQVDAMRVAKNLMDFNQFGGATEMAIVSASRGLPS